LNAEPPGRTAAGEEHLPLILERNQHRIGNLPRPPRFHELAIPSDYVLIHIEQQLQAGGDVLTRHLTEIRSDGVRRFGGQRAEFELVGELQEFS
jgi:hypothetical protein